MVGAIGIPAWESENPAARILETFLSFSFHKMFQQTVLEGAFKQAFMYLDLM